MCQAHAYTTIAVYIIVTMINYKYYRVYILYSLYRVSQVKTNMGSASYCSIKAKYDIIIIIVVNKISHCILNIK